MNVTIGTDAAAYDTNVVDVGGVTTDYGTTAANSGPFTVLLQPGEQIYFTSSVPTAWTWRGA